MKNKAKKDKKPKPYKKSPAYLAGQMDAKFILSAMGKVSWWFSASMPYSRGLTRKSKENSHPKLWRYCEGFCDAFKSYAEENDLEWDDDKCQPSQEDIGK